MESDPQARRAGLLYGLAAYGLWGLVPLYFHELTEKKVSPPEVLAHRIVWSVVLLAVALSLARRWGEVGRCLRAAPVRRRLLATTLLIALNWLTFIYSVSIGQVVQTSLGYYITPLVTVVLGLVFLGERLRPWQWVALLLAGAGVVTLVVGGGGVPWVALTLATSFGLYGLLRKQAAADALVGLTVETALLLPAAVCFLVYRAAVGSLALGTVDRRLDVLLVLSGVVTTVPLFCFGEAAHRLRLSTVGFLQYLSPSISLVLAVTVMGEEFSRLELASFACIWVGLAVYSVDAALAWRGRPDAGEAPEPLCDL